MPAIKKKLTWLHVCLALSLAVLPLVKDAKSQSYNQLGYCQINPLSAVTATTLATTPNPCTTGSIPSGAKYMEICVSAAAVRYISAGSLTPTAAIGIPVPVGACFAFSGNLYSLNVIAQATGAILDIEYFQ